MVKRICVFGGIGTFSDQSYTSLIEKTQTWQKSKSYLDIANNDTIIVALKTVIYQLCLYELWLSWGVTFDCVLGLSLGEICAAHVSGFYTLEETLELTKDLATIVSAQSGWMAHGYNITPTENCVITSHNFENDEDGVHVTLAGLYEEDFTTLSYAYCSLKKMYVHNPWHHTVYKNKHICVPESKFSSMLFLSTLTNCLKTTGSTLEKTHWNDWLCSMSNMVKVTNTLKQQFVNETIEIVEISGHPTLYDMLEPLHSSVYVYSHSRDFVQSPEFIFEQRKKVLPMESLLLGCVEDTI